MRRVLTRIQQSFPATRRPKSSRFYMRTEQTLQRKYLSVAEDLRLAAPWRHLSRLVFALEILLLERRSLWNSTSVGRVQGKLLGSCACHGEGNTVGV